MVYLGERFVNISPACSKVAIANRGDAPAGNSRPVYKTDIIHIIC